MRIRPQPNRKIRRKSFKEQPLKENPNSSISYNIFSKNVNHGYNRATQIYKIDLFHLESGKFNKQRIPVCPNQQFNQTTIEHTNFEENSNQNPPYNHSKRKKENEEGKKRSAWTLNKKSWTLQRNWTGKSSNSLQPNKKTTGSCSESCLSSETKLQWVKWVIIEVGVDEKAGIVVVEK